MKKRICAFVLLSIMLLGITAQAVSLRAVRPNATFAIDGTTATCDLFVTSSGDSISASMELWQGNKRIASWSDSGTSVVTLSGSKTVTKGKTYTMKYYVKVNGRSISIDPITKTCK